MSSLKLPAAPAISASLVSASLSPAAVAVGEEIIQEIVNATLPHLATIVWHWYNTQSTSGFFGWAEHSLLGPIFTALFGANPGVAQAPAVIAAPAGGTIAGS